MNIIHRLLITPSECFNLSINRQLESHFIQEGYMKLKPLLYPCTIEFSLMCLTVSSAFICRKSNRLFLVILSYLGKYWKNFCT